MNKTATNSLLKDPLLASNNDAIDDDAYLFPEGYYDLFDSWLETNDTKSGAPDVQNISNTNSPLFEETTETDDYLEEEHTDFSQMHSTDSLNDQLAETDTKKIPILTTPLLTEIIDTKIPAVQKTEDIIQAPSKSDLLDDEFFNAPLLENTATVFSGISQKPSITLENLDNIDEKLLSKKLTKSNSDSIVSTAMKQLFVLRYLSFTKNKLRYWFGPAKANSDIKEIIFSIDQEIKKGQLKGKPSIIKNSILKYTEAISFRDNINKFKLFKDEFNHSSLNNTLKEIITIEEILGE